MEGSVTIARVMMLCPVKCISLVQRLYGVDGGLFCRYCCTAEFIRSSLNSKLDYEELNDFEQSRSKSKVQRRT